MCMKRILPFWILLSFFTIFAADTASAAVKGEVSMEAVPVYGDAGKEGSHVPIVINVCGDGFAGYAAVDAYENGNNGASLIYRYEYPVRTDENGDFGIEVYVPLGRDLNELTVRLFDEDGEELEEEQLAFDVSRDRGRLIIGALSDDPESLMYLDEVNLNYGMVRSVLTVLDKETFPDDERGLEILDVLVVNDFDLSSLSKDQENAMLEWVYDGGTLLFGTGEDAERTLGDIADIILSDPVSNLGYRSVNMGAEYARENPGDSDIDLYCVEVTLNEGREVLESDGFTLLTMTDLGNGEIGVFSFDLSGISDFASDNPAFPARFLMEIFGEDRLSRIYFYSSAGLNTSYWDAQSLVGSADAAESPNITAYVIAAACYLVLIVVIFFVLRRYDLSRHYGILVIALSGVFAAFIWLVGSQTRYNAEFYNCAGVVNISDGGAWETVFVNARTPDGRGYSFSVDPEYAVTPLFGEGPRSMPEGARGRDGTAPEPDVTIAYGEETTILTVKKSQAFESSFYKLTRSFTDGPEVGIDSDLVFFDGKLKGTVTNGFPFDLYDAAIVAYGQVIPISGTFASGETLNFSGEEALIWPVGMERLLARMITEADEIAAGSEDYAGSTELTALYTYYLENGFGSFSPGFTLIALGPAEGLCEELSAGAAKADGRMLYAIDLDVSRYEDGAFYISGQSKKPEAVAGTGLVNDDSMTLYGSDPLTVRYYPRSDIIIEKISFLPVSDIFTEDPDYGYLKVFDGETYLYNNLTGEFDKVDILGGDLAAADLKDYLMEDNSFIVRYVPRAQDTGEQTLLLPLLMVTGRSTDA